MNKRGCAEPQPAPSPIKFQNMALSESAKANIANLKSCIESAQRDIERCNITIKNNNARTGNKSAGDNAKIVKKQKQERIKAWRAQIASIRKNG